jgi:transposase InsO family protein
MVENQLNRKIKVLRSDGGGEYFSNEFNSFLRSNGIMRQITARYTPQMNGVAERKNRHILETVKAMLFEENLSKRFWADACHYAVTLINRMPTTIIGNNTPFQLVFSKKPRVDTLKVFGCVWYVHVPQEVRHKLDEKSI